MIKKRGIAFALTLAMLVSSMPYGVLASGQENPEPETSVVEEVLPAKTEEAAAAETEAATEAAEEVQAQEMPAEDAAEADSEAAAAPAEEEIVFDVETEADVMVTEEAAADAVDASADYTPVSLKRLGADSTDKYTVGYDNISQCWDFGFLDMEITYANGVTEEWYDFSEGSTDSHGNATGVGLYSDSAATKQVTSVTASGTYYVKVSCGSASTTYPVTWQTVAQAAQEHAALTTSSPVTCVRSGQFASVKFVPTAAGNYVFSTEADAGICVVIVLDSSGTQIARDKNTVSASLQAGKTYYIVISMAVANTVTVSADMAKTLSGVSLAKAADSISVFGLTDEASINQSYPLTVSYTDGTTESLAWEMEQVAGTGTCYSATGKSGDKIWLRLYSDGEELGFETAAAGSYTLRAAAAGNASLLSEQTITVTQYPSDTAALITGQTSEKRSLAAGGEAWYSFRPGLCGSYTLTASASATITLYEKTDTGYDTVRKSQGSYTGLKAGTTYLCRAVAGTAAEDFTILPEYKGNTLEYHAKKDSTCSEAGTKEYWQCTICGKYYSDKNENTEIAAPETIATKEHTWGEWKTTSAATALAAEKQTRTCSVCGTKETKSVGSKLAGTIKVNASSLTMKTGQTSTAFKAYGFATGDYLKKVTSSKTSVVKVTNVSKTGTMKLTAGSKTGTATLTLTMAGGATKKVTVKVKSAAVKTTSISGVAKTLTLQKGKTAKLAPTVSPITSQDKVTYKSSNTKIVRVSSKGLVKAVAPGKAVVTVQSGTKKVTCTVTVQVKNTKLTGVSSKLTLAVGKTKTLTPKRYPSNSTDTITYTSSAKSVATVSSSGKITAKKAGKAVITVKCGSATVKCTVTVK